MEIKICPRCGGTEADCPICGAPPQRSEESRRSALAVGVAEPAFPGLAAAISALWAVQGVDVSAWNGTMHFDITKTKCQYVYVRVGYGNVWKDGRCDKYRQDLLSIDMPYGVYWYVKAGQDWEQHAESFVKIASEYPFQLDIVMDVEYTSLSPVATLTWLINMEKRIYALTGKKPMIYSSAGFWNSKVAPSSYFNNHRKWAANWTTAPTPYLPSGWSAWTHWQWSADNNGLGIEYGSSPDGDKDMDLNRYNGSVAEFNAMYGTHILPIGEEPPPPSDLPDKVIINTGVLNIRSTPDARSGANVIGTTTLGKGWNPIAIALGPDQNGMTREWWQINKYAFIAKWLTIW